MKTRPVDALKLDVEAFANAGEELAGQWPVSSMERLVDLIPPEAVDAASQPVDWKLSGERRPVRGDVPQVWLHLQLHTTLTMQCQRCLQPVPVPLDVDSSFRFVRDEATAEALDADSEEDILVLERVLDTRQLAEDELLLTLPVVALHDVCPEPLPVPDEEVDMGPEEESQPHPFAGLAALKRGNRN